jgi:two-component system, sensor histidine kinase and response regulator
MKTILIIEDDRAVRESIQDCLEVNGFQILSAATGVRGVQLSQEHLPDLVLCDVQMPGIDGYDVLATLRQFTTTAMIPFIFLTAKNSRSDFRYGMELGADDYLTKPFTPQDLLRAVDARLGKQAVARAEAQRQLDHLRHSIALSLPHEFRTPITGILTAVELLRHSADDPSQVRTLADSVQSSTERLYKMVQHFLLYADLEVTAHNPTGSPPPPQGKTFDPCPLISVAATKLARNAGRSRDLELDLQSAEVALSEPNLLKILDALIDNAFKFSEPGTPVQISTTVAPTGLLLQIIDHGRGMTLDQIANLGAYMQFDRRRHEQQGSGLGLIIAKRLVELHGGQFRIQSIPHQRTTVQAILPLLSPQERGPGAGQNL